MAGISATNLQKEEQSQLVKVHATRRKISCPRVRIHASFQIVRTTEEPSHTCACFTKRICRKYKFSGFGKTTSPCCKTCVLGLGTHKMKNKIRQVPHFNDVTFISQDNHANSVPQRNTMGLKFRHLTLTTRRRESAICRFRS